MEIAIKVIQFSTDFGGNPLPYVPAFREWNAHVVSCVQCAHADQLVRQLAGDDGTAEVDHEELERLFNLLCEGGKMLQHNVTRRMAHQHEISLRN
jgi:hypothetical protein